MKETQRDAGIQTGAIMPQNRDSGPVMARPETTDAAAQEAVVRQPGRKEQRALQPVVSRSAIAEPMHAPAPVVAPDASRNGSQVVLVDTVASRIAIDQPQYEEDRILTIVEGDGDGETEKKPYIRREIKRAGELLRAARGKFVTPGSIATTVGYSIPDGKFIEDFEEGKMPDPPLRSIIDSADKLIDSDDAGMKELLEIGETLEEEAKWMWRIDHDDLHMGEKIRLIRLSFGMSKQGFAERSGITYGRLANIENGRKPKFFTLNFALGVNNFDKRFRRPAQRMRLDACDQQPQTIEEFDQESFGGNIEYFRIQRGLSRGELADRMTEKLHQNGKKQRKTKQYIDRVEQNKLKQISNHDYTALFDVLEVPQELREYLVQKKQGERQELTSGQQDMLLDTFYFNFDGLTVTTIPFTHSDRQAYRSLKSKDDFGSALGSLREYLDLRLKDIESWRRLINKLENSEHIPEDFLVARIAIAMGFSPLDDTSLLLQKLAANEREKHQRGNAAHFAKNRRAPEEQPELEQDAVSI